MALERRAQLEPALAAESARDREDAFDQVSRLNFGLTADEVMDEWEFDPDDLIDPHEACSEHDEAAKFYALGWDVTDEAGRPLLVLKHFDRQLALVVNGAIELVSGRDPEAWGAALEAERESFQKSRRLGRR